MELHKVSFADTNAFSKSFLDYIEGNHQLTKFYNRPPDLTSFREQINDKATSFSQSTRQLLADTLMAQYASLEAPEAVNKNIAALRESTTFTVTTGHQLNIFTGPLYFIYKIVTVINACKQLRQQYPQHTFVPVYWMASEDHDFDEIKYLKLYGKKYTWESAQTGAVGRFNPKELKTLLADVPGAIELFKTAYLKHNTLADAVRYYVNALFGHEGLVVVDGDSRALKSVLAQVMEDDLFRHTAKGLVDTTNAALEALGYKTQVYARDCNFFYLDTNLRARLEREGDAFRVVDTPHTFTADAIRTMIRETPEKLSPNVILRPLYQEMILPNLAYVGGPAEVVYWLQLKEVFGKYNTPFPILMPRNFAMVIDAPAWRKFEKTGIQLTDLFKEKHALFNHIATVFATHTIKLNGEKEAIENYFKTIQQQASAIDSTLGPLVGAEMSRAVKSLEKIESKLLKAEKRFQSDRLRQVEAVKDTLFPGGGLQERTDNFLNFYQQDPQFIQKLVMHFDPFDFRFNVLALTS